MAMDSIALAGTLDRSVEEGIAAQRAGDAALATRHYKAALSLSPAHPEANHNLGIVLLQGGMIEDALPHFRTALQHDAERELYWISYARALLIAGRRSQALAVLDEARSVNVQPDAIETMLELAKSVPPESGALSFPLDYLAEKQAEILSKSGDYAGAVHRLKQAVTHRPTADTLWLRLGDARASAGDNQGAIDALESALNLNPELAEAHHHLGSLLSEGDQIDAGFAHLRQRAELVHSHAPAPQDPELPHKEKHDFEQLVHLKRKGIFTSSEGALPFYVGDGSRVAGEAVNRANARPDLAARWACATPRVLVFDDFLQPDALKKLRDYCADSTVWKRVYDAGYIGATPADGFAAPLLAQIIEEIQDVYAPILAGEPFRYLGAFKYDSELSTGTNTHADYSLINVNLYIAPDEANLDPATGGMIVWDEEAGSEAELRRYNSDEEGLAKLLLDRRAKSFRIPHRTNRAVIFASNLFHKTDECDFAEGYLNKRINVSFLFGDWVKPSA